jgi:hypothetical protein
MGYDPQKTAPTAGVSGDGGGDRDRAFWGKGGSNVTQVATHLPLFSVHDSGTAAGTAFCPV